MKDNNEIWKEIFTNNNIAIIKNNYDDYILLANDYEDIYDEYEITEYDYKKIIECPIEDLDEIIENIIYAYNAGEDEECDIDNDWRYSNYEEKGIEDWDVDDHLACWFDHMMEK